MATTVFNIVPINLTEFDFEALASVSTNGRLDPNWGAMFLEQRLPGILQILWHTEQAMKQNTQVMLEEVLPRYEKLQKLTQIGAPYMDDLNQLTGYIKQQYPIIINEVKHMLKYAHQLTQLLEQFEQMHPGSTSQGKSVAQSFSHQLSLIYGQLIKRSILVVKQPDEIIKKLNQFETQIQLLVDVGSVAPTVRIRIISAADAELLKAGNTQCTKISPAATTNHNQAKFINSNGTLLSHFDKKPVLKEISSRTHTTGGKRLTVTEQKYVVLYEIVPSSDLEKKLGCTETIWALSLPIVLIVHANQLSDAYATIVWDRMFDSANEADWAKFAWLLKVTFKHICGATIRSLSDNDITYFRQKLDVKPNGRLTFQRFAKDKITSDFSFWTWLESIAQLIKAKLLPYWEKGYIMGFSSKEEVSEMMNNYNHAAFLLRFSDSKLGTVAVSTFRHDNTGHMQHAPYLLPVEKLGNADSLVNLLRDFDQIQNIRYICCFSNATYDKPFTPIDKAIVFADPELNVKANGSAAPEAATGYHKLKTVIKGESTNDADGGIRERCDSTSSTATRVASAFGQWPPRSSSADAGISNVDDSNLSFDFSASAATNEPRPYSMEASSFQQPMMGSWGTPATDINFFGLVPHPHGENASQWSSSSTGHGSNQLHDESNASLPVGVYAAMAGTPMDQDSTWNQYYSS